MGFFAAMQLLTTIPVPWGSARPGSGVMFFPLVGLVLGGVLAGLYSLLSLVLPAALVSALLVAALALLTGGLHLDGFLDTCDGLAGHRSVEDRLRIMHDSRAGGIGVVATAILILVKYVSLSSVPAALMMPALLLMPVVSRWTMVYSIFAYPYARPTGLGKAFKQSTGWGDFIVATLIMIAVAVALKPASLLAIAGVFVFILAVNAYFNRRLAGLTGDTYGAVNELAEVATLVTLIVLSRVELI